MDREFEKDIGKLRKVKKSDLSKSEKKLRKESLQEKKRKEKELEKLRKEREKIFGADSSQITGEDLEASLDKSKSKYFFLKTSKT